MRDISDFVKKTVNAENNTITYEGLGELSKEIVYPVYSENSDITVIFQDTVGKSNGKVWYTEVVGFYFGKPNINLIEEYEGKLQATFD